MQLSSLLLKLNLSMNSAARKKMWKVSLLLLFSALIVYALSQPMRAGRFRFDTDAAFASRSASKAVTESDIAQSNACFPPPSGLVSRWAGEGNANDLSSGNHGQLEGGAGYVSGHVGKAFSFDGTGQVRVAHNANLNVQALTIEAWVYPALVDGVMDTIVCKEPDAAMYQYYLAIRGPDNSYGAGTIPRGNLAFYLTEANGLPITGLPSNEFFGWVDGGGQIPLFTWTHVALTFDGSSAKAYLNGVLTRNITGLTGMSNVTSGPFRIGSRSDFQIGITPQDRFNGLIDEVALYNRALSASEIQSIFNAGKFGKCSATNVSAASFLVDNFGSFPPSASCGCASYFSVSHFSV